MKKTLFVQLLLIAFCLLQSMELLAKEPDFRDGNLYYQVTDIENRECYVYGPVSNDVINKLVVPSTAQCNGVVFNVVGVVGNSFYGNSSLRSSQFSQVISIVLPNSVRRIDQYAFKECKALTSIRMEGVERIEEGAFTRCENLKSIGTFNNLKYVGFNGFSECRNIEKVVIPPSCIEIGDGAFSGCENPKYTLVIEDGDTPLRSSIDFGSGKKIYIGRNIISPQSARYQGIVYRFQEVEYGDKVTEMLYPNTPLDVETIHHLTIGFSIKEVPDFSLQDLDIKVIHMASEVPPTLKSNPFVHSEGSFTNRTFLNCTLYVPKGSLSAYRNAPVWKNFINIQEYESEKTIARKRAAEQAEQERIAEQKRKEEQALREKAEREAQIERERLARIDARRNVVVPSGTIEIASKAYAKNKEMESVLIPNSVTSIGDEAFENCRKLSSVQFGNNVRSVGQNAFANCWVLSTITIPNSVTSIGSSAFYGCNKLSSVTIGSGVTSIAENTFSGCESLTSVTIPNSVTSIGQGAFYSCSSLTSITLPNSIKKIEREAFSRSGLKSITIPGSVAFIEHDAFSGSKLTTVSLMEGIKYIGYGAFSSCSNLKSVVIPSSVTSIGTYAFAWCSSLTSLTIPQAVTSIGEDAFKGCSQLNITLPKKFRRKVNLKDCKSVKYY